jgi:hypothetical protein
MGNYGWGHVRHAAGRCFDNLGLGAGAVQAAEESMPVRSRERFARPRAFSLGVQAIGYAQAGEIEQACTVSHELIALTARLGSRRVRIRLRKILRELSGHQDLPAARDVHEAARQILTTPSQ